MATTVSTFWAPYGFSRRRQWWVWYIVWANGDLERTGEDYPPWTVACELQTVTFSWERDGVHRGEYAVEWLPDGQREEWLRPAGIGPNDF